MILFVLILLGLYSGYRFWLDRNTGELWQAARNGDLPRVQHLVASGEDPSQRKGLHDETPLHAAAGSGHVEIARYLLQAGASVSARDSDGYTPLHACARYNVHGGPSKKTEDERNQIATMLISHGADVNSRSASMADTPLHLAAFEGNRRLAQILLEHGANVNAIQGNGFTPLHLVCSPRQDDSAFAELLLEHGADPSLTSDSGATALDLAIKYAPRVADAIRNHAGTAERNRE